MQKLDSPRDIIPFQKPQDSIFSTLINRKLSRVISFVFLKYTSITPTQVNILSFVISAAGCWLFLADQYSWRMVGVLLLQLGFTLDCCDGEIARFKNQANAFGAWLDSVLDRFKEAIMLTALTAAWYLHHDASLTVVLTGAAAIIMLQLVSYLREAKKSSWPRQRTAELFISKRMYIGTVDVTIYLVCAAVLFQAELYGLWFFLLISLPMLAKQFLSAYRLFKAGLR